MRMEFVMVTPEMAMAWLKSNNALNRNMRHRVIDKYAADMRSGDWHLSPQGIAFYEDGSLADGQHRLAAVIRASMPVQFLIVYDVPREVGVCIDQHAQRRMEDALRLGGAPQWIGKDAIAIIRWMASQGASVAQLSISQIEMYAEKFEPQLRFAIGLIANHRKNITGAGMACQYVLADLAGERRELLTRFAEIMFSGEISSKNENAAVRLREFLLSDSSAWNGAFKVPTAKRAQRAIEAFCRGRPLAKLYQPEEWIYPFPAISSVLPTFNRIARFGNDKLKKALFSENRK